MDPVTKAMFYRGWPLAPFMVCLVHGLRFHSSGVEGCVLVLDGVLFVVALYATKPLASDFCGGVVNFEVETVYRI